jgi:NADP-dependent aldehyde dehydrogenase
VDPRTGEPGEAVPMALTTDVDGAVVDAAAAFRDPAWEDGARRARLLRRAAERLAALGDRIADVAGRETGLASARLGAETERTVLQLRLFADVIEHGRYLDATIDTYDSDARPLPRPDLRRVQMPVGPVAVFGASNFPLAFGVAGGDTASAWAAGCPVIAKGHPAHPATNALLAKELREALSETGLPGAALTLLQSDDVRLGESLVEHPLLSAVAFTGSHRAGRALFDRAARRPHPIPVYAEMGSANPVLLTAAAQRQRGEEIAAGLAGAVLANAGQLCTKPNVVLLLPGPGTEAFLTALASHFAEADPGPMLHADIRDAFDGSLEPLRRAEEVEVLSQGPPTAAAVGSRGIALLAPGSLALSRDALLEEHFGPGVVLLRLSRAEETWELLDRLGGQLTLTVHAEQPEDDAFVERLLPALAAKAGRVVFDGFPTGVAVTAAMVHGGPYPATTSPRDTSVGTASIGRFLRPVAFQGVPDRFLPPALQDANPLRVQRTIDDVTTTDPVHPV